MSCDVTDVTCHHRKPQTPQEKDQAKRARKKDKAEEGQKGAAHQRKGVAELRLARREGSFSGSNEWLFVLFAS